MVNDHINALTEMVIQDSARNPELTPAVHKHGHRIKSGVTTLKVSSKPQNATPSFRA